jgi:lysozyme family protein
MFYDVFNAEGFGQRDPAGGAIAGIRQSTLDAAKAAGIVPRDTALDRLTYQQVVAIYRWNADNEIGRIGGVRRYEEFDDPKDATAVFDTLFAHGHGVGANAIQEGINETLKRLSDADLKRLGLPSQIDEDRVVGSRTFRILTALANNGHGHLFRQQLAGARARWVKRKIEEELHTGWFSRIDRFR